MKIALLTVLALLLAGCGKSGFSINDPLDYMQPKPVAPYDVYIAPTGSMRPTFVGGERVHVAVIDIRDVKVGDIIATYWEADHLPIVHRVVRVFVAANGEIGLVTKGDAYGTPDARITTKSELIGLVVRITK